MEVLITIISSLISSFVGKKFGMNIGIQIGTLIGLMIREYVKRYPSLIPNILQQNKIEIKQIKPDDEPNPVFNRVEEYILKTHMEQIKSMALIFDRGSLNLELSTSKISVRDIFEKHSITLMLEEKPKRDNHNNRTIIIKSRTASIKEIKEYVEKIVKFTGDLPEMYTVFSPVVSRRPNDNTFVRWDRGITVKSKKTLNNTIFTKSVEEQLDIEKFLGERDIYDAMNTPYRRGYCLYGPPGTGKTTAIAAVANQFNLDVFRINLNIIPSDYHFDQLISSIDSDDRVYILVFEDIDRTDFFKRLTNPEDNNGAKGISVGCLLNILDGLTGANGRITFFTLNDELALRSCDALFRPGRIDKKILVPYCDSNQVKRLFLSYFPTVDVDEEKIKIHISKISPAELTRIVYDNITSPQAVLNKIYSEKTKNE